MDVTKLLSSDAPEQQTTSRYTSSAPQHGIHPPHAPYTPAGQGPPHGYEPPPPGFARQPSSRSQPPNLAPVGPPVTHPPSHSPASHYATQQSPYSNRSGSSARHQSGYEQPATPAQYQSGQAFPLQQHQPMSPTPPSGSSHTPRSSHQSPMPALQHGGPPPQYHNAYASPSASGYHRASPNQPRQTPGSAHRVGSNDLASPITLLQQSPSTRRPSEQHFHRARETSVDISPKSQPMPRPSSMSSRQGSFHESLAYPSGQLPENAPWSSHQQNPPLPPGPVLHSRMSSMTSNSYNHPSASPVQYQQTAERPQVKRSQTMTMGHVLSNAAPVTQPAENQERVPSVNGEEYKHETDSRKRAPEEELQSARPAKKGKTTRRVERPIWAQLSRRNPAWTIENGFKGKPRAEQNGHVQPQAQQVGPVRSNGNPVQSINRTSPWLNPSPYDMDLLSAREVMGEWEKSMSWNTPYPDMLRVVQDWIFQHLSAHQDIANDPSVGTIEIEAKIGQLVKPNTGERAGLPVLNMTVLDPRFNRDYRFESELEESDFVTFNGFMNETLKQSIQPGRTHMSYARVLEVDSFWHLSAQAHSMLPKSLSKQQMHGRELKLRTTQDIKSNRITASIIKAPIADLHIYNPNGYDCRISMNAEVNLMRPGLRHEDLVTNATEDRPNAPSRRKDRLSYRHLAYQIDLTNVQVSSLPTKYEMEIEVDARVLGHQIRLMTSHQPHAYGDVVSGFLDNATFLMRQRR